ncbi:hypothetical protein CFAEC_00160 [Corynebacterium faecale]|nr:hypothetical protein CFAEC_00160 [Corynebacterium faecale]
MEPNVLSKQSDLDMAQKIWTYQELINSGKTRRQIDTAVKDRKITRIFRGMYIMGTPTGSLVWAAVRQHRREVALDGRSAIESYLDRPLSIPITVRMPATSRTDLKSNYVRGIRSSRMPDAMRVTLIDAIATCLDDASLANRYLHQAVEQYYRGDLGTRRLHQELSQLGARSGQKLSAFLMVAITGTDSELEVKLVSLLQRHGFITEQNISIGGYKWDVCIRGLWVLIDLDSWHYHGGSNGDQFILDRWKNNHAAALGWTALRITDTCLNYNQEELINFLKQIHAFRVDFPNARLKDIESSPVWSWHSELIPSEFR